VSPSRLWVDPPLLKRRPRLDSPSRGRAARKRVAGPGSRGSWDTDPRWRATDSLAGEKTACQWLSWTGVSTVLSLGVCGHVAAVRPAPARQA